MQIILICFKKVSSFNILSYLLLKLQLQLWNMQLLWSVAFLLKRNFFFVVKKLIASVYFPFYFFYEKSFILKRWRFSSRQFYELLQSCKNSKCMKEVLWRIYAKYDFTPFLIYLKIRFFCKLLTCVGIA